MQWLLPVPDRSVRTCWGPHRTRDCLVSVLYATDREATTRSGPPQTTDHGMVTKSRLLFNPFRDNTHASMRQVALHTGLAKSRVHQRGQARGPPRSPSRIVVVGNQRGAPVVHPPGGRGPRDVWPQVRGGSGNDARVVRVPSPGAAYGVCTEHLAGRDGHAGPPHLGDDRGGGRAGIATE